jgi:alcohol dehydrogenase (cytochrome c)
MAYHPRTRAFYIPLKLSCARSVFDAYTSPADMARGGNGIAKRDFARHPASPDEIGEFLAMDSRTGKALWRQRNRMPYNTAALTTAGDLVFVGDISGRFSAMDVETGKVMWEVKTATAADGFPITYAVGGKQYLAVPSGPGWFLGWQQVRDFFPEVPRPAASGSAIQVYALPEN